MRELTTVDLACGAASGTVRRITVTAETTDNPHLVIAPGVGHRDGDDVFLNQFNVVHVHTGLRIPGDPFGADDLHAARRFARAIRHLDWSFTARDQVDDETWKALVAAVKAAQRTLPEVTAPDPDTVSDEGPAESAKTAAEAVPEAVRYAQAAWERWHLGLPNPDGTRTKVPFETEDGGRNELYMQLLHVALESFSVAYLMAALQRMDPRGADSAIRWLHETQEGGEGVGEFLWEWNRAVENGEPLNLPGVMPYIDPDAPILAPVTA